MIDYSRNYLAISDDLQTKIAEQRLLVIGLGIGSVLAELAVRTGFRKLTIVDHDLVSLSNLNRQDYTEDDVEISKAKACEKRLLAIDHSIHLNTVDQFADVPFLQQHIPNHEFIINTIDFDAPEFQVCTRISQELGKIELFPINLGFACAVFVFSKSQTWESMFPNSTPIDLKKNILEFMFYSGKLTPYLKEKMVAYFNMPQRPFDPQLAISSQLVSALSITLLVRILAGEDIKSIPHFYFLDARVD